MTKKTNLVLEQIATCIQETKKSTLKEQVNRYLPNVQACKEGFAVSDLIDFSSLKLHDDSEVDLELLKVRLETSHHGFMPYTAYSLAISSLEGESGNLGRFIYQESIPGLPRIRLLSKLRNTSYDERAKDIYEYIDSLTINKQRLSSFKDIATRNFVKGIETENI